MGSRRQLIVILLLSSFSPLVTVNLLLAQVSVTWLSDFEYPLNSDGDEFIHGGRGLSSVLVGDVNGDGIEDLAIYGAQDSEGENTGVCWLLFMDDDFGVDDYAEIGTVTEGLPVWGALAALGDFDGDGVPDLVARTEDGVAILLLGSDGSLDDYYTITSDDEVFGSDMRDDWRFGRSIAVLGDLDGNGVTDIAVGVPEYDADEHWGDDIEEAQECTRCGAVYILFLEEDGTVDDYKIITQGLSGFDQSLAQSGDFGWACVGVGDLNGDGEMDLAVGQPKDRTRNNGEGSVWILFLESDGEVEDAAYVVPPDADRAKLYSPYNFASSVNYLGEVFGAPVIAIGAYHTGHDDLAGDLWLVGLTDEAEIESSTLLSNEIGGIGDLFIPGDWLGSSLTNLGDLDGDGVPELLLGAGKFETDWGDRDGALVILHMGYDFLRGDANGDGEVSALSDSLYLLRYLFVRDDAPPCLEAGDANDNGDLGITDALYLLHYAYNDGPEPDAPGVSECSWDPTTSPLPCAEDPCN